MIPQNYCMAGGTHVFDMIKRLRDNENLSKRNYFKKQTGTTNRRGEYVDHGSATKEHLDEIKKQTLADRRNEEKKSIIILVAAVVIVTIGIIIFLSFMDAIASRQ